MIIEFRIWESSFDGIIIMDTRVLVSIIGSEGVGVVVLVVDSTIVWIGIWSVTETYGIYVVMIS